MWWPGSRRAPTGRTSLSASSRRKPVPRCNFIPLSVIAALGVSYDARFSLVSSHISWKLFTFHHPFFNLYNCEDGISNLGWIYRLYIKQAPSRTFTPDDDDEPEWTEYKIKETNIFTADKYQQVNFRSSKLQLMSWISSDSSNDSFYLTI